MKLLKNMVNYKLNLLTTDELLKYAEEFHIKLSRGQAEKIAAHIRGKNLDIFDDRTRTQLVREVAKIAGPETAREVNKLFIQFTK